MAAVTDIVASELASINQNGIAAELFDDMLKENKCSYRNYLQPMRVRVLMF